MIVFSCLFHRKKAGGIFPIQKYTARFCCKNSSVIPLVIQVVETMVLLFGLKTRTCHLLDLGEAARFTKSKNSGANRKRR